jgi:choline dehydrogenase-like flavoprotein
VLRYDTATDSWSSLVSLPQARGAGGLVLLGRVLHFFGGTTKLWAGFCSPFDPIDFEKRDWVPDSGWPIRKEDLDPFYEKAHPLLELGPYNYDLNYWREKDPSLAAFALDEKAVYNKVWQFSPPTRFGKKYRDAVVNARNVHLYTHANVTAIETDENASHVTEVTCKNLQGREHRVRARFILACNAVQTRPLLASNRTARHGLESERPGGKVLHGACGNQFRQAHLLKQSAQAISMRILKKVS